MITTMRELVLEIKRVGFSQLRVDNGITLWGFKEFRFKTPVTNDVPSAQLLAQWNQVKTDTFGAYPGLRARRGVNQPIEIIKSTEDIVLKEGGQPDAGPVVMNHVDAGSTPAPPAIMETTRMEPIVATDALVGSIPTSLPNNIAPREDQPVARTKSDACEECGGPKYGRGYKHKKGCALARGGTVDSPREKRDKGIIIKSDSYPAILIAFEDATKNLVAAVKSLIAERDMYKAERDESSVFVEQMRSFLNKKKS